MLRGENVENVGGLGCGPKERDCWSALVRWCLIQYSYAKLSSNAAGELFKPERQEADSSKDSNETA